MSVLNLWCLLVLVLCSGRRRMHKQGGHIWTHRNFLPDEEFGSRIVGGEDVSITQLPYQVSLQYHRRHYCGGAIITSIHVVTAAHCTSTVKAADLNIRAGSTYRDYGGLVAAVALVVPHPMYNEDSEDYDVAVLKLNGRLPFNGYIQPIAVVERGVRWTPGTPAIVSGWGLMVEDAEEGTQPQTLQATVLQVMEVAQCRLKYGGQSISERMLCVGVLEGGRDSCQGDSGGPLVIDGILAGLVSFGKGCARPGIPGVYTNVSAVRGFIEHAATL